jgi:hypothetical protein
MKRIKWIGILTLCLYTGIAKAQDCTNSEDCIQKADKAFNLKDAIGFLDKALKFGKKEGINLSVLYVRRGIKYYYNSIPMPKEAEREFRSAIKEDAKNIWPHIWLGYVYSRTQNDYKKSNDHFTQVVQLFPDHPTVLYERGHNHRYHRSDALAAIDIEKAYGLILADASKVDATLAAQIVRWHAEMYMRSTKLSVADDQVVKILEAGYNLSPNNGELLGDLSLAYFDTDNIEKAKELGAKANTLAENNTGGKLIEGIDAHTAKSYYAAASSLNHASEASLHRHPLISYYHAITHWDHSLNSDNKSLWGSYKAQIKNNLEFVVANAPGTKWEAYASYAKENLSVMAEDQNRVNNLPENVLNRRLFQLQGNLFFNVNTKGIYYAVPNKPMYEGDLVRLDGLHDDPKQTMEVYEKIENLENTAIYKKITGKKGCPVCSGRGYISNTYKQTVADYEYTLGKKIVQTTTRSNSCGNCGGCGLVPNN